MTEYSENAETPALEETPQNEIPVENNLNVDTPSYEENSNIEIPTMENMNNELPTNEILTTDDTNQNNLETVSLDDPISQAFVE